MPMNRERFNMAIMRKNCRTVIANQRGVGLIEVMIALLVLGVGLLGIAAMQATALRNSQSSLERTQAVIQSYAILDAMRANLAEARIGSYNIGMTCDAPSTGNLVANDLNQWIVSMKTALNESACGSINCSSERCDVTVQWDDSRGGTSSESGDTLQQIETSTKL